MRRCNYLASGLIFLATGCGPLPRAKSFYGTLEKWPLSAGGTGLVLVSTDPSFSSSNVYFYNFGTGELSPLATGESGDVLKKWDGRTFWLFNRASGKTSYSRFSPKIGPTSRTVERRTPDAQAYDPADWIGLSSGESAMALASSHKVSIANLATGMTLTSDLGDVDTNNSSIPFRPGVLLANFSYSRSDSRGDRDFAVLHQALTNDWKALGGGRIYLAQLNANGRWGWVDQNLTAAGIQGITLNVSNPITTVDCEQTGSGILLADSKVSCLIVGVCYASMGNACVGGVDEVDWNLKSVRHVFDWPAGSQIAGGVTGGAKSGQIIACLKAANEANAKLTVIDATSGQVGASWDAGSSSCGSFHVDREGGRAFAVKNSDQSAAVYALSADLTEISRVNLGFAVSDMEVINE